MSVDRPPQIAAAAERLRAEKTVPALLIASARSFGQMLNAPACTISRVIGDLLVDLVEYEPTGQQRGRLGHGYLISDYPLTRAVIEELEPRTVFSGDPGADPNEAGLLAELGFDSLLMVAIEGGDGAWGLVEVYADKGQRFSDEQVSLARDLAREVGDRLRQLERSA